MLSMSSLQATTITTSTLLDAEVSVDGGVAGCSGQVLSLSVGNVLAVSLDVPLGEPEVDEEHLVAGLVVAHAEVVGLDVAVDEVPVVDVLDPGDHLVHQHQHGLQRKLSEGVFKEGFEGFSHEVHHEDVVVACICRKIPSVEQ
jgi:hypothetical protein